MYYSHDVLFLIGRQIEKFMQNEVKTTENIQHHTQII